MPHETRTAAGVEVIPLCDAVGPMGDALRRPLTETFPGSTPADFDSDTWVLHFHCFLLRAPGGHNILVDTGIGTTDSPAATWAPVPGRLLAELAEAGLTPDDVDTVILTHLHSDHASGAVADGRPVFRNARHVLQQAELDSVAAAVRDTLVQPLRDRLHIVEGETTLLPGVQVIPAPGHTPGHQIVRVGELAVTGDLVLHPAQLTNPELTYIYDDDPQQAATTRRTVLAALRAANGLLATSHFPTPFVPAP